MPQRPPHPQQRSRQIILRCCCPRTISSHVAPSLNTRLRPNVHHANITPCRNDRPIHSTAAGKSFSGAALHHHQVPERAAHSPHAATPRRIWLAKLDDRSVHRPLAARYRLNEWKRAEPTPSTSRCSPARACCRSCRLRRHRAATSGSQCVLSAALSLPSRAIITPLSVRTFGCKANAYYWPMPLGARGPA